MAKLKKTSLTQIEPSLDEEFEAELADLIERYALKGLETEKVVDTLEKHSAQIATAVALAYVNMGIKIFVVGTCTLVPIFMLMLNIHEPWMYGTMLLSYLAVVMQFFDLEGVVELVRRLKREGLL